MQKKKHLLVPVMIGIAVSLSLFSCGGRSTITRAADEYVVADSSAISTDTASSDNTIAANSAHPDFIRTADLKFNVKDVSAATSAIEELTKQEGGFVTYTNMVSTVDRTDNTPISKDSALETTYYTVSNDMTIRVPNSQLDTTLKMISGLVDFLDHRTIKADDVALQLLTNNLTQKRSVKTAVRMSHAIDSRGRKLAETTEAEGLLSDREEQSDEALVANRSLTDQINYSTISLSFYQRQSNKRVLLANDTDIEAYQPGFGSRLLESLSVGLDGLESLIVFVVQCWSVFVLMLLLFIVYKAYMLRRSHKE